MYRLNDGEIISIIFQCRSQIITDNLIGKVRSVVTNCLIIDIAGQDYIILFHGIICALMAMKCHCCCSMFTLY
jgi:hypothetical protein